MLFDGGGGGGGGGLQFCKDTELNCHLLPLKIKFWGSKIRGLPPSPFLCHCMFIVHISHAQCDLFQDYEQISITTEPPVQANLLLLQSHKPDSFSPLSVLISVIHVKVGRKSLGNCLERVVSKILCIILQAETSTVV